MANKNTRQAMARYRAENRKSWPKFVQRSVHRSSPGPLGAGPKLTEQAVMFGHAAIVPTGMNRQDLLIKYSHGH